MHKSIVTAVAAIFLVAGVAYVAMNPEVLSRLTGSVTGSTQGGDLATSAITPIEFYVKIDGVKTGWIKGESKVKTHPDWIRGYAYESGITSPRDPATGQASGKRVHEPLTFLKQVDRASPLLSQAIATNEVLSTVQFQFVRPEATTNVPFVYYEVTLRGATMSSLHVGDTLGTSGLVHETLSLTYETIEWSYRTAPTATPTQFQDSVYVAS